METKAQKSSNNKNRRDIKLHTKYPNRTYLLCEYLNKIYALIDEYDLAGRIDVLEKVYDSLI